MKTLYLLRHAKSSWKHDVIDHQRPLKKRGLNDAELVSKHVKKKVKAPEKIISSDAERALTTALFFKEAFKIADKDFSTNHNLYDFGGRQVLEIIKNLNDSWDRVMIVGHNHAFTSIANMLGDEYIENLPTCGFVQINFDEDHWRDVNVGKTKFTVFPRDLKPKEDE